MAKTIVITGANSGIGRATAKALASQGYSIVTICRNKVEGDKLVAELKRNNPSIQAENVVADLSDLNSVKKAAEIILSNHSTVDRLINNAGYYPPAIEYVNGVEKSFVASHLGHMLLTELLMPALKKSPEARVINVSSALHSQGKVSRFFTKPSDHNPQQAYGDAKLANILFTIELAKRLPDNVTTYSLHPGVVNTNFGNTVTGMMKVMITIFKPFFITPEKGAVTSIYLAEENIQQLKQHSGKYFAKSELAKINNPAATEVNANWLWDKSTEILKSYF
ncbi:MAG TPA: SDR family NAD(P)-dependent oxidoreductase [Cyclobacteriaceae bacterium]